MKAGDIVYLRGYKPARIVTGRVSMRNTVLIEFCDGCGRSWHDAEKVKRATVPVKA